MRSSNGATIKWIALVLLACCFTMLSASCRLGSWSFLRPGPGLRDLGSVFYGGDHVTFTRASAAVALEKHRLTPPPMVAGNRIFHLVDCRAIALSNNLDIQVARLEEITKKSIEHSNRTKLLPHLVCSGELSERDNTLYSYSDPMGFEGQAPEAGGGVGVNNWATSHERGTWRYSWETRWSPTDAALAFYVTRSSVNDTIKAHYQKVRVAQKLIGIVDSSYFRLLSLQECMPIAEELVSVCTRVAKNTERLLEKRLKPLEDYHRAKQRLIKARGILDSVRNEMEKERNNLASAMALAPGFGKDCGIRVEGKLQHPSFKGDICQMEMEAVVNRPEAYQAGLNHFNSINDLRRTIVRYFPKVTGFWRWTHDKDKYIWNKDWKDVGMYIYLDVLDWIVNRDESRAADAMVVKTQREVGAVALGITSQVRIAGLKYFEALDKLRSAEESLKSSQKVLQITQEKLQRDAVAELAVDDAKAGLLQDRIEKIRGLGEANAALAELNAVMGMNYNEPLAHSK